MEVGWIAQHVGKGEGRKQGKDGSTSETEPWIFSSLDQRANNFHIQVPEQLKISLLKSTLGSDKKIVLLKLLMMPFMDIVNIQIFCYHRFGFKYILILLNIIIHAPMERFQLELINYFTYFSPSPRQRCVSFLQAFCHNMTFSTGLVSVEVSSVSWLGKFNCTFCLIGSGVCELDVGCSEEILL